MKQWIWLILLLFVAGCSTTKSGIEKSYDVTINVSGGSMAEFVMGVEAETEGTTASGDAPADASVDPAVALGMQGSTTSAAAKGAEQLLQDIVSRVEAWQKSQDDNRKTNSDNTTNNETNQPVVPSGNDSVVTPVDPNPIPDPPPVSGYKFNQKGEYKGVIHISGNYPHRWVWPLDGPDYGESLLIKCDDGQEMFVADTKTPYIIGEGNRKYVPGKPYFPGADAHQTMEYYADYGTKPNSCSVYFNKEGVVEPPVADALTFDCSGTMSYRDCDTCESVPQTICMLDTWDKCSDIPYQPFKVTWVDSSGNTRSLNVPDKCGIAMLNKEEGYGKFRYEHDKAPFKPVTYAPRGFNAVKVILQP